LFVAHGVADVLLVLFVVHLRRMQLRRSQAGRRPVAATRRAVPAPRREDTSGGGSVRVQPGSVAVLEEAGYGEETGWGEEAGWGDAEHAQATGVDGQVPGHAAVGVPEPVVASVARHDEPLSVSPGLGAPWSPVPVPPPIYASAPVAPRVARNVDLTRPGYAESVTAGERLPGMEDEVPGTERQTEPRRAVNDW
jgi:hypothetical protein